MCTVNPIITGKAALSGKTQANLQLPFTRRHLPMARTGTGLTFVMPFKIKGPTESGCLGMLLFYLFPHVLQ